MDPRGRGGARPLRPADRSRLHALPAKLRAAPGGAVVAGPRSPSRGCAGRRIGGHDPERRHDPRAPEHLADAVRRRRDRCLRGPCRPAPEPQPRRRAPGRRRRRPGRPGHPDLADAAGRPERPSVRPAGPVRPDRPCRPGGGQSAADPFRARARLPDLALGRPRHGAEPRSGARHRRRRGGAAPRPRHSLPPPRRIPDQRHLGRHRHGDRARQPLGRAPRRPLARRCRRRPPVGLRRRGHRRPRPGAGVPAARPLAPGRPLGRGPGPRLDLDAAAGAGPADPRGDRRPRGDRPADRTDRHRRRPRSGRPHRACPLRLRPALGDALGLRSASSRRRPASFRGWSRMPPSPASACWPAALPSTTASAQPPDH